MRQRASRITAFLMTAVLLISCMCVNFSVAVQASADGFIADFEPNGEIPDTVTTSGGEAAPSLTSVVDPRNEHGHALKATIAAGSGDSRHSYLTFSYTRSERFDGISFWIKAETAMTIDVRARIGEQDIRSLGRVTLQAGEARNVTALYADARYTTSLNISTIGQPVSFQPAVDAPIRLYVYTLGKTTEKRYIIDDVCQYASGGETASNDHTVAYQNSDNISYYKETASGSMVQDFEADSAASFMTLTGADSQTSSITANTTVVNTGTKSVKVISNQTNNQDGVLTFTYNKAAQWNSLSFWMATGQTIDLNVKVTINNGTPLRILRQTVQAEYSGLIFAKFPDSLKTYAGSVKVELVVSCSKTTAVMWFDSIMQTNVTKPVVADTTQTGNLSDDAAAPTHGQVVTDFEAYSNNAALYTEWDYASENDWLAGKFYLDRGNRYRGYNSLRMDYDFSYTENPTKQKLSVQGPLQAINEYGVGLYIYSSQAVVLDITLFDEAGHFLTLRLPANQYDDAVFVNLGSTIGGNSNFGRLNRGDLSIRLTIMPSNDTLTGTVYVDDIWYSNIAVNPECAVAHIFSNTCDTSCNRCGYTRAVTHTPDPDDGNCETDTLCSICRKVLTSGEDNHVFTNSCDAVCNNCPYTREATHIPENDDGDCTTAVHCSICGEVTTAGAESHVFENNCDTTCENCQYTRETEHTPEQDDGDCTTAIHCSICGEVTTAGAANHTFTDEQDTTCNVCEYTRTVGLIADFEPNGTITATTSGGSAPALESVTDPRDENGHAVKATIPAGKANVHSYLIFNYTHIPGYEGVTFWIQAQTAITFEVRIERGSMGEYPIRRVTLQAGESQTITALYADITDRGSLNNPSLGAIEWPYDIEGQPLKVKVYALGGSTEKSYIIDSVAQYNETVIEDEQDDDFVVITDFEPNGDITAATASGSCAPTLTPVADPRDEQGHALKVTIPQAASASAVHSYVNFAYAHRTGYAGLSFWIKAETAITFEVRVERGSMGEYPIRRVTLQAGEAQKITALYADITDRGSLNNPPLGPIDWPYSYDGNAFMKVKLYALGSTSTTKSYIVDDVGQCNPNFSGASLSLSDDIAVNYKIRPDELAGNTATVDFIQDDTVVSTVSTPVEENGYYVYRYEHIDPSKINDTITAVLKINGKTVNTTEYSVATYCYNMLEKNPQNIPLRRLLVDILEYGAKAQLYTGNNTTNLATSHLTDVQKAWGTVGDPTLSPVSRILTPVEGAVNLTASWKAVGLYLDDSVNIRLTFETEEDISGITARISSNTVQPTIVSSFKSLGNNQYSFLITSLTVAQVRDVVNVVLYNGDIAISNMVSYSVETYAASKINANNAALAELMKALIKYGDSAKQYIA